MNTPQDQDFERFETLVSLWSGAYKCFVNSYVALKTSKGPRLLFGRVLLELSRVKTSDIGFRFETEHLLAARFSTATTSGYFPLLLAKARSGGMCAIDGTGEIILEADRVLSTYFAPIYHPQLSEGPRLPSLIIHGISKHGLHVNVIDAKELDWELKAATTPFENLDELLGHCGLPTFSQMGDQTTFEIVARSPGTISGKSMITGGEAVIECHAAEALDVGEIRLGYKIFGKERTERGSVNGSSFQWHQEDDFKIGIWRAPVGDVALLQAFLSYAGISLQQWWVTDPQKQLNPRHAIHQIFDQDLELLKRMLLRPETSKPYEFENAVSTLLSLLGFSVGSYGRIPKLQKGPDIIALSPAGHVGIVECTVGILDENDKLAKLVQREKLVREKLVQAGYSYLLLQAVIVTRSRAIK